MGVDEESCIGNPVNEYNQHNPDYTVHPGDHIVEHLRRMSEKEYYDKFKDQAATKQLILAIIADKQIIKESEATLLEFWFKKPKESWLNSQQQYDTWKRAAGTWNK